MPADLPSRPPLDLDALAARAPDWMQVEVVAESPSTNRALSQTLGGDSADPHGRVLVAEHQTAGRGRLDRVWTTPSRAALTFSTAVRPDGLEPDRWPWLPLLLGLAVTDGIVAAGGPPCRLKWPNDVMYDGLKLGGLLVERVDTPNGPAAVLGVGLNVSTSRAELPVETATSLLLAGWLSADRTALLAAILIALSSRLRDLRNGPDVLHRAYVERCDTVGREVKVSLPGARILEGRATGIGADGSLVVRTGGGEVPVSAGDVVHVR